MYISFDSLFKILCLHMYYYSSINVVSMATATVGPAGGAQWCAEGETTQSGEDGHETRQAVYGEWACI